MLIDYHLHNHFSPDSEANTADLIQHVQNLNIQHICITNHGEWFDSIEEHVGIFEYNDVKKRFQGIKQELDELRPKFPDMDVRFGIELQYDPKAMNDIKRIIEELPFDFILGSVHVIDSIVISGGEHAGEIFGNMDEEAAYTKYFNEMLAWVETGLMDAVAHFDIVKKYGTEYYGPFQPEKYKPIILKILQAMKNKGIGIELNTSCLHKRCKEIFPHPDILKWCLEVGIENFTLGTDAHDIEIAGKYIPEAMEIAKSVGIPTISTYDKRKPTFNFI